MQLLCSASASSKHTDRIHNCSPDASPPLCLQAASALAHKALCACSGKSGARLSRKSAPAADYDLTGQIMWPAAQLLADHLAANTHILAGCACALELGSGLGFPGLIAAQASLGLVHYAGCIRCCNLHAVLEDHMTCIPGGRDGRLSAYSGLLPVHARAQLWPRLSRVHCRPSLAMLALCLTGVIACATSCTSCSRIWSGPVKTGGCDACSTVRSS